MALRYGNLIIADQAFSALKDLNLQAVLAYNFPDGKFYINWATLGKIKGQEGVVEIAVDPDNQPPANFVFEYYPGDASTKDSWSHFKSDYLSANSNDNSNWAAEYDPASSPPAESPPAPAEPKPPSGGGAGGGGTDEGDTTLADFLVKHLDLAWKNIPENLKSSKYKGSDQNLKAGITNKPGKFGPSQARGVASFAAECLNLNLPSSDLLNSKYNEAVRVSLTSMRDEWAQGPARPDLGVWKGLTLGTLIFDGDKPGLVEFLRFAYALTSKEAAGLSKMEISPEGADAGLYAYLCFMGAISPFEFMRFVGPESSIPAGARISFPLTGPTAVAKKGPQPETGDVTFTTSQSGQIYVMQLCSNQETENDADVDYETSIKIAKSLGNITNFTLSFSGKTYKQSGKIGYGQVITFAAEVAARADVEPRSSRRADVTLSRTVRLKWPRGTAGGRRNFTMENKYLDASGAARTRKIEVQLRKGIGLNDNYELEPVQSPYILIPLFLPALIREAHWSIGVITGSSKKSEKPAACLAVSNISWSFDGRYYTVGGSTSEDGGAGAAIRLVEFEESKVEPSEEVMLVKRDELGNEAALAAVRSYLSSNSNPVGEALILNKTLNEPINSYPMAQTRTG